MDAYLTIIEPSGSPSTRISFQLIGRRGRSGVGKTKVQNGLLYPRLHNSEQEYNVMYLSNRFKTWNCKFEE